MLLSDCVTYTAEKHPERTALVSGERSWTFAELDDRVRRGAHAIAALSAPADRIAVLAENRPEYVELYYAAPRAGRGLLFLNYRLHPRELVRILDDAAPTVLVTEPEHLATVRAIVPELAVTPAVVLAGGDGSEDGVHAYETLLADAPDGEAVTGVDDRSLAWLIYTSGTTGMPKGAMLSHANLLAAITNSAIGWDRAPEPDVFLNPWPLCHVAGYAVPVQHLLGNAVVIMRAYEPAAFVELIARHRCTFTSGAPTMLSMLLRHPALRDADLSSLKRIGYGAAAMPAEVLRELMDRLPGVEFATGFGMTELAGNIFSFTGPEHVDALRDDPRVLGSVGRLMPLAVARVVDDEMHDVAVGQVGELVVRGPQVMTGYWNRPDATAEAFAGGWFHTGDLARWDDGGRCYIVDRKKDMILTGGENVYSREVEEVLYQHPAVAEAAVVGLPDPHWGETVAAVVQLRDGATATADELIAHCREHLAGYKRPRTVVFRGEMPKTASGKILKRELRTELVDGVSRSPAGG